MPATNSGCRNRFSEDTEAVESFGTVESRCFFFVAPLIPHPKGVSEEESRKETGFQSERVEVFVLDFGEGNKN